MYKSVFLLYCIFTFYSNSCMEKREDILAYLDISLHMKALNQIASLYAKAADLASFDLNEHMDVLGAKTSQGIFLEIYYGYPLYLWTPWGSVWLQKCLHDQRKEHFLAALETTLYREEEKTWHEKNGPIYKITKINHLSLPEAVEASPAHFLDAKEAKKEWARALSSMEHTQQ